MTRGRWLAVALAAAAALLLARAFADAFVEYRWFAAFGAGALDVWRARAIDLTLLRVAATLVAGAFLYLNLLGVASTIDAVAVSRRLGGIEIAETVPAGRLRGLFAAASVLFGIAMALPITDWVGADALLTGRTFGEIEPYTGRDLAFFVYWLPFENGLYAWALVVVAFVTGAVIALYALTPGLRWARGRIRATVRVRRHLALFGVATLLLLAWGHRLDAYALLVSGSGANGAFVGIDALALLPTRFALAIISALAAVVVLRAGWSGHARLAFWAVTGVVVATILGRSLAGPLATSLLAPSQIAIANGAASANRALYTRRAYASDDVLEATDTASAGLPTARGAADNVAIWEAAALSRTASPVAADTHLVHSAVGWQVAGDTIAAVIATPRVATVPALAEVGARGATPSGWRATFADPRTGAPLQTPVRILGARVPPIDVPAVVYPGAADAAVVSDATGHVVGDSFRSWGVRLAAALAARDMRLLRTDERDRGDVRLVRRRDPRARVQALLPYFTIARDVTPVVAADSLWWAVTVLAANADYPLSAHLASDRVDSDEVATLRHAGSALVNAATGSVRLFAPSAPDADTRAWYARFPRLTTRLDSVDPALASALPIPYDAALAQARTFAEFGPRGARVLPAARVLLTDAAEGGSFANPATAFVGTGATGIPAIATAFPVVTSADRVAGVIVATGGRVPRATFVPASQPGPRWQDVLDSTATLQEQAGGRPNPSGVVDGGVRVVPTSDGLLFVRSHYTAAQDARPLLAGVTAVLGARVSHGATLREVFDSGAPPRTSSAPAAPLTSTQRLDAARALYDDARRALGRGEWAGFGRALDALGRMLTPSP